MPRPLSLSQQQGQAAQEQFCWLEKQQRTGGTWLRWAHRAGVGQTAGKELEQGVPSQPCGRSRKGHQERAGKSRAQPCIRIQTFPAAPGQLQAAEHPSPPSDGSLDLPQPSPFFFSSLKPGVHIFWDLSLCPNWILLSGNRAWKDKGQQEGEKPRTAPWHLLAICEE